VNTTSQLFFVNSKKSFLFLRMNHKIATPRVSPFSRFLLNILYRSEDREPTFSVGTSCTIDEPSFSCICATALDECYLENKKRNIII
jgi:hypothetical protein